MVLVSEYTVLSPLGVHFVYSPRPKGLSEYTCTPLCDKTVYSLQNHKIFVVYCWLGPSVRLVIYLFPCTRDF